MPPELALNGSSGFMDSPNSLSTFDTPKKLKFFELADKYRKDTGKWPDIGSLCDAVGVSIRSFYRHIEADPKFKSEWDERLLRGEARLTSKLHDASHPIAQLAWLRRYFPERWNPAYQMNVTVDSKQNEKLLGAARQYIDAEVVPNPTNVSTPKTVNEQVDKST